VDAEITYPVAGILRVADVTADKATADEAGRRNDAEQEAVDGPRAASLLGNLAGSDTWKEPSEEADLPVGKTATQRTTKLAHC